MSAQRFADKANKIGRYGKNAAIAIPDFLLLAHANNYVFFSYVILNGF
jgi:hypothetical protein